jgi:hypothetical protein
VTNLDVRFHFGSGETLTISAGSVNDALSIVNALSQGRNVNYVNENTGECFLIIASQVTMVEHRAGKL